VAYAAGQFFFTYHAEIREVCMSKKVIVSIFFGLVFCLAVLQAAEPPKKYLSRSDLKAFKENFSRIEEDFDNLDVSYDSLLDFSGDTNSEGLAALASITAPVEVERILQKNGISAPSFTKYMVISYGIGVLYLEKGLKEQVSLYASMPEVAASLEQALQEIQVLKSEIHQADLALIADDLEALAAIVSDE